MIIVDFSGMAIAAILAQINTSTELSEDLLRHIILSTILSYRKRFHDEYGELLFAADGRHYWRKQVYPHYKANRKKSRDQSGLDWKFIFDSLNKIKQELKENFPYRFIELDTAEADDVIATICKESQNHKVKVGLFEQAERILILSGDKDFLQLQKYKNVAQFSPMQKKFLRSDSPIKDLKEKILRGDAGDGVPNVLSDDDAFVAPDKRQSTLRQKRVDELLPKEPEQFGDDKVLRNFRRNEQLIDLSKVPDYIEQGILEEYKKPEVGKRSKLLNYFIQYKLKYLTESISEF